MADTSITTSDAAPTNMYLDGSSQTMAVPNNTSWVFKAIIIGRSSGGTGSSAIKIEGMIVNNGGTVFVSGVNSTVITGSWSATAVTSGTSLALRVTGAAATNIRWVGRVETAEVTF